MRKLILLLITVLILFTSCATSVDVHYLQPSEIDMGQARTIAIASTQPYSGRTGGREYIRFSNFVDYSWYFTSSYSDMRLKNKVATYATSALYDTLSSSGYFTIIDSEITDSILAAGKAGFNTNSMFLEKGVDAVIIPRISGMDIDEYIYRDAYDKKVYDAVSKQEVIVKDYKYYLSQTVTLDYEYSIISTKTEQLIATKRFSKTYHNEDVAINYYSSYSSEYDLYYMFRACINSFQNTILKQLVPLGRTANITLMENKPKDKTIEQAYDLVKDGNIIGAKQMFLDHYNATGFIPSGYNSALLSAAISDFDTAIAELQSMLSVTSNAEVYNLLGQLQVYKKKTQEAESQIMGTSEGFKSDSSINIYSQVMGY